MNREATCRRVKNKATSSLNGKDEFVSAVRSRFPLVVQVMLRVVRSRGLLGIGIRRANPSPATRAPRSLEVGRAAEQSAERHSKPHYLLHLNDLHTFRCLLHLSHSECVLWCVDWEWRGRFVGSGRHLFAAWSSVIVSYLELLYQ